MFERILIANRGEVAARVARACREMGVQPVGVYSRADRGASWLELMEEAVCVGPAPASESYLRGERLLGQLEGVVPNPKIVVTMGSAGNGAEFV